MPDDPIPLDYQCPVCGEKAIAGSHFCRQSAPATPVRTKRRRRSKTVGGLARLAGIVAVTGIFWPWVGPWSLLWLAVGAGLILLWQNRRR